MTEPEEPATPAPPTPAADPAVKPPSRQVLFVVGGGMIAALVASLGVAVLLPNGDPARPHTTSAAADPIVLSPSANPSSAPGSAPASGPAGEPAASPSASPKPGPTTTTAGHTRTPTAQKTTAAGSQVTSARITLSPASTQSHCDPGTDLVTVTVTVTVSQPGVRLRFSVNGGGEHGGIAQSKTYTESWPIFIQHTAGDHRVGLTVTAPSNATDTAIYKVTCVGH